MMTRRGRTSLVLAAGIGAALLYPLSYCLVIPLTENFGIGYGFIGYTLYRPVEYLRVKSDLVWKITERGYTAMGGKSDPLKRTNSDKTVLKFLGFGFGPDGRLVHRRLAKQRSEHTLFVETWYDTGITRDKYAEDSPGGFRFQEWYRTGNRSLEERVNPDHSGRWWCWGRDGTLLGECELRNCRPWNGKTVCWVHRPPGWEDEGQPGPEPLIERTYANGDLVGTRSFSYPPAARVAPMPGALDEVRH